MGFGKLEFDNMEKTILLAGQKFGFHILAILFQTRQGRGFNSLLHDIPKITPRTLSLRLKDLEGKGLISKNIAMGPKIKIEYRLTEKGEGFERALDGLARTGAKL
ncbi:helix-turn-helix transcriptional regulator [Candidatus Micrarchaeota archaeon]|nr:helix-turn-helix transcriptional regulator [Candidatus Micrarchaeota archaeon]MBU1930531.1 helix-turn-helix transcriptional regulator [Candidatus Micrarchaeota archaeon]